MEASDKTAFRLSLISAAGEASWSLVSHFCCPTLGSLSHDLPQSGFLADRHKKLTVYCVAFFFLMKLDRCLQNPARVLLPLPFTAPLAPPPCLRRAETEQAWNSCHHWGRCWTPTLSTLQGDCSLGPKGCTDSNVLCALAQTIIQTKMK